MRCLSACGPCAEICDICRKSYEDYQAAHSGMSWGGFNIRGDKKSMEEVARLMHVAGTWEHIDRALRERIARLEQENLTLLNSQDDLSRRLRETQEDRDALAVRISRAKGALG